VKSRSHTQKEVGDDGATLDATRQSSNWSTPSLSRRSKRALGHSSGALTKTFRVRYRIDGVLHEMKSPPKRLQRPSSAG